MIRHNIDKMKVDGLYVGYSSGENFLISIGRKVFSKLNTSEVS